MGLVVSVERLEGILLEHAPELVAPVLAEVWRIAKDSKPVRKVKVSVPVHETGPMEIFEQHCDRCGSMLRGGEDAMALKELPSACCLPCWEKEPETYRNRSVSRVHVVADFSEAA